MLHVQSLCQKTGKKTANLEVLRNYLKTRSKKIYFKKREIIYCGKSNLGKDLIGINE